MALNTMLSAASVALSGLAYNRDGFSDNVSLRQNQIYQEKNYHIAWIAAVREEVRDIMMIFVGRMSNSNVVSSLCAAIVAGSILEGDVADTCPDFVAHLFYISMYISGMYLLMAVMNASGGISVAYRSGMAFLVAVVPDPLDSYDHNYMQQVTRNFERDAWQVFRPPLYDLVTGWGGGGLGKRPRGAAMRATPPLEQLPRGLGRPASAPSLRAAATVRPTGLAAAAPQAGSGHRDGGRASADSYFQTLRMYSELWEPFAVAADESLVHGVLSFAHGFTYYALGRLYDRSERWAALTILAMFIVMLAALFSDPGTSSILSRSACEEERTDEGTQEEVETGPGRRRGGCQPLSLLLLVAGPTACAVADRAALSWMDAVFVPLSFLFHVFLSLAFSLTAFRGFCGHGTPCSRLKAAVRLGMAAQALPRRWGVSEQGDDLEAGVTRGRATAKAVSASGTRPEGEEERGSACATRAPSPAEAAREDQEVLLVDLLERSRHEIKATLRTIRASTGLVHGIAALAWLSMFGWSLVVHVRGSDVFQPLLPVEDVRVEWPSSHFKPHAVACAHGHVFMADRFGIYELLGEALQPLACNLSQPVTDLAVACQGSRCWPLALVNGSPSSIVSCISGGSATLLQAPGTAERLATHGESAVAVLHGHELLQYSWVAARNTLRPQWQLADVDNGGLQAIDLVQDAGGGSHLLLFRGAATGRASRRAEAVLEVAALDPTYSQRAPSPAPPLAAIAGWLRIG
mmetsp:Transcript_88506/g.245886  ORF Transcript_88506/g.245886 Transcript_88506/m.245886 type:complete len:746 (+) Transcript_88506:111-2348(+)